MRILITGDRNWDFKQAEAVVNRLIAKHTREDMLIVHGDCPTGVDAAFELAATRWGILTEKHPANWDKFGDRAGPIRNQEMVDLNADFCIAVHRGLSRSKGTKDCVNRCLKAAIVVYLISDASAKPQRIYSTEKA